MSDNSFKRQSSTLTIELHTSKDDARPVYLTGNFNGWKTSDPAFKMTRLGPGRYAYSFLDFTLNDLPSIEYKYVKGGWESEELDKDGRPTRNRILRTSKGKVVDTVANWKVHEAWYDPRFYPIIEVAAKQFNLPQLRRRRRISALLPYNYYTEPNKRFPVLYLQDGQNLFESSAPYGTWGVDRQLAKLAQEGKGEVIVVAIDHGGRQRVNEYSPVHTKQFGEGLGKDYACFLTETLKPYIDEKYRTLPDRNNTGIGGSSMGGLISLYSGLLYPQVYSKYMIFSPSLWLTPSMLDAFRIKDQQPNTRYYFFAGGKEPGGAARNTELLHNILAQKQTQGVKSQFSLNPEATHSEYYWGNAFPEGIRSLFF